MPQSKVVNRRRLIRDSASLTTASPDVKHADIVRKQNTLQVRIEAWREYQDLYMPGVARLRSETTTSARGCKPENWPLHLPSQVKRDSLAPQYRLLEDIELRLRRAQANDTLDQLKRHLRARARLLSVKKHDVTGQKRNTRSWGYINTVQSRINADVSRYRAAYSALSILDPNNTSDWQRTLKPLVNGDVREMKDGLPGETEGRRSLSWIWKTSGWSGADDDDEDEQEGKSLCIGSCISSRLGLY